MEPVPSQTGDEHPVFAPSFNRSDTAERSQNSAAAVRVSSTFIISIN